MDNINNLIPELENIVGDYTDETDYKKLIQLDPKIHTHDKLLIKQLSDVPVDVLLQYREMYNLALQFNTFIKQRYYLSPEYLVSIFLRFQILYPEFETISDLKKINYDMYYSREESLRPITLESYIFREAEIFFINIMENSDFTETEIIESIIDSNTSEIVKRYKNVPETHNGDISEIKKVVYTFIIESTSDMLINFFGNNSNMRYVDKSLQYLEEYKSELYTVILSYAEDYNTESDESDE
jgi:hypothetical protein